MHDFYVLDGHGSVVGLINAAGTSTATYTYTYDPYGTQLTGTGNGDIVGPNPLRYAAGLTERGTGWTKYGIRYNDTTVGRFTAQDPSPASSTPTTATATPTPERTRSTILTPAARTSRSAAQQVTSTP